MLNSLILLIVSLSVLLGSCSIYKIDTQQGNVITQAMVNRLKPGMDKRQVRYLLGTPLVEDAFTRNRWDYYYSFRKGGNKTLQQRRITLIFGSDGKLTAINGDVRPANQHFAPAKPLSASLD